jgi:hypothetical protein
MDAALRRIKCQRDLGEVLKWCPVTSIRRDGFDLTSEDYAQISLQSVMPVALLAVLAEELMKNWGIRGTVVRV